MAVEATDSLSLCLENLRRTVAASATFRAVVGAADEAAARLRVHKFEAKDDGSQPMPRAVVGYADAQEADGEAVGVLIRSGPLYVAFEFPTPEAYLDDRSDGCTDFTNKLGAILREMAEAAAADPSSYLPVASFTLNGPENEPPARNTGKVGGVESSPDHWWAEFVVNWWGQ